MLEGKPKARWILIAAYCQFTMTSCDLDYMTTGWVPLLSQLSIFWSTN